MHPKFNNILRSADSGAGTGGAGGEGSSTGGAGSTGSTGEESSKSSEVTFTQEELNKIIADRLARQTTSQQEALVKDFGMTPEELKNFVAEAKKAADSRKSAEELALSKAEEAVKAASDREQAATARETAAALKEYNAEVRTELLGEGINKDNVSIVARLLDTAPGATEEEIKAAIVKLKAQMPQLFVDTKTGLPKTDPGSGNGSGDNKSAKEIGEDLAKKYVEKGSKAAGLYAGL